MIQRLISDPTMGRFIDPVAQPESKFLENFDAQLKTRFGVSLDQIDPSWSEDLSRSDLERVGGLDWLEANMAPTDGDSVDDSSRSTTIHSGSNGI